MKDAQVIKMLEAKIRDLENILFRRNEELKTLETEKNTLLKAALDVGCFCPYGIGHPGFSKHTWDCENLQKAIGSVIRG